MTPRDRAALARAAGREGMWSDRRVQHFDQWCQPNSAVPVAVPR